ncbi:transposase, partial [Megasphaera cerevisiae DSM 20462]
MYKTPSKQLSFEDFNQPLGLHMDPNNRWIKKAAFIPWDLVEKKYKKLFKGFKGHVAKPARMALGALLIQIEYGYSDEETVEQIKENPYLQYFCGLLGYEYKAPFDASAMTRFRKRLTPKRL